MALQPPKIITQDPGAHELEESSDDHFSSADEGTPNPNTNTNRYSDTGSPIPITRVERVDSLPAHGEVPGTPAYAIRTQDAVPDEIEIVPEGQRSRSGTRSRALSNLSVASGHSNSRPGTPRSPGGSPIPKTVVERVDDKPAHGEVQGTAAWEIRQADAEPDEVKRVEESEGREEGNIKQPPVSEEDRQAWFRSMWEGDASKESVVPAGTEVKGEEVDDEQLKNDDDDDFGDDFDDFAQGQEGGDDDFGDFDEETPMALEPAPEPVQQPQLPDALAGLPALDLTSSDSLNTYLSTIFPADPPTPPATPPSTDPATPFLSDRSLSLWQQLLHPPPMAPPNWTRSRIRRLFLVSLGVPVDLDEILPVSKMKRLILPNTTNPDDDFEGRKRPSTQMDRLKTGNASANASSTSLDSKTGAPKRSPHPPASSRRTRGPPPPPSFDLNAAALLCATTDAKLSGLDDDELAAHLEVLREGCKTGEMVVEYWLGRVEEGLKEKEALEGVIENLVGFVRGRR